MQVTRTPPPPPQSHTCVTHTHTHTHRPPCDTAVRTQGWSDRTPESPSRDRGCPGGGNRRRSGRSRSAPRSSARPNRRCRCMCPGCRCCSNNRCRYSRSAQRSSPGSRTHRLLLDAPATAPLLVAVDPCCLLVCVNMCEAMGWVSLGRASVWCIMLCCVEA
jgi:hypothetical protein